MKYFSLSELGASNESDFHPGFLEKLVALREHVAQPFHVTSGARTKKRNAEIGGSSKSLHISDEPQHGGQLGCMAVDVAALTPSFKIELVKAALLMGWSVGINDKKRFVHIDRRVDIGLPQAVFSY